MSEHSIMNLCLSASAALNESEAASARRELISAYADWMAVFAPWKSFVTLTVSNAHSCSKDGLHRRWRSLVQILNRDLYGNHYTRIVGHCYFSYVIGFEFTKSGAVHLHALVDKPINFELVHRVWNKMSGFAYIEPVYDLPGIAGYMCKYIVKHGDLIFHRPVKSPLPSFVPLWFSDHL